MDKKDIRDFTLEELKKELEGIQEPAYRANQIFFWLYQRGPLDFSDFTNLPQKLRDNLGDRYFIRDLELKERLRSCDKTEKFLFKLRDGNFIETVLIPVESGRKTVCLSTQVGCKFACSFCASGLGGFTRNLRPGEMTGQVLFLQNRLKYHLTNFVFMGMGEPLDNYENVTKAILIMNSRQSMGIAARRITISTCGVIPGIERLKNFGLQVNLSLSLHAANNELRNKLMPINKKYPLEKLIEVCEDFIEASGRKITLEYVLIQDMNDSKQDAEGLATIARRLRAKVNLIPYSFVCGLGYKAPSKSGMAEFMSLLERKNVSVTLRSSKGQDIQAACGQLAGRRGSNNASMDEDASVFKKI
jgi:23S rRNA (adenine2503-C2)-methyltransferase